MKISTIQKIVTIFLSLTFFTSFSAEHSWKDSFSHYPSHYAMPGGIIAVLITGGIVRYYYQNYSLPHNKNIENYRLTYKNIHQDVQNHYSFYQNDAQKSDWELKNTILCNNQNMYPFMAYYASLLKTSWEIQNHIRIIDKQLKEIKTCRKKLYYHRHSEKTPHLKEAFTQLEKKGESLRKLATQAASLITILRSRVKLFKEYEDDSNNWSQAESSNRFDHVPPPSLQS